MDACTFCGIVSGKKSAHIVFEDDESMAFLDAEPIFHGHCLLVPKKHVENLMETPEPLLAHLSAVSKELSIAVKNAMSCHGILIINNNVVSQSVPHMHVHIIPRNRGDGLKGFMWPRHLYKDDKEAEATAERIKKELGKDRLKK